MDIQEIIAYINQNVTHPQQLEGMRGMGLSLEELPESYHAKKQKTDSGIEYYICSRNEETREKMLERLQQNIRKEFIQQKQGERNIGLMNEFPLIDKLDNILKESKQVIFTGAPGTGKTYTVRDYVKQKKAAGTGEYEFVQFHASYDYSDFVEGLRPVQMLNSDNPTFVRLDGTFKRFCREVVRDNEERESQGQPLKNHYFIIDEINRADLSNVFGELMFALEEANRGSENCFPTQYANLNTYEMKDGRAVLLENDCFKDGFYVPENVYILGTMNDIDRSVEAFDFALRRRFRWVEVKANDEMLYVLQSMLGNIGTEKNDAAKSSSEDIEQLVQSVIKMNGVISKRTDLGLDEAYHIGPAYFKTYDGNNLEVIWTERLEPILREYCRGRSKSVVDQFVEECQKTLFEETEGSYGNNG